MGAPLNPSPSAATLRKRRQVARIKAEKRTLVLLTPAPETTQALQKLARVTGRGVKGEGEAILRRAAGSALQELQVMAAKFGEVYRAAQPYMEYAEFLRTPGTSRRIGERELKADDWLPLAQKLGAFGDWTRRQGWKEGRAKAFLEAAAAGRLDL